MASGLSHFTEANVTPRSGAALCSLLLTLYNYCYGAEPGCEIPAGQRGAVTTETSGEGYSCSEPPHSLQMHAHLVTCSQLMPCATQQHSRELCSVACPQHTTFFGHGQCYAGNEKQPDKRTPQQASPCTEPGLESSAVPQEPRKGRLTL